MGADMSDDGRLEILAFGELGLVRSGRPVPLGPPKQRLILAVLLVRVDTDVSPAELIDAVWGEHPPASAADNVRLYIFRLRQALGPDIIVGHGKPGYCLRGDRVGIDVRRFRALHAAGAALLTGGDLLVARSVLVEAALLRRGRPFAGLPANPVLDPYRRTLEELWLLASEQRFQIDLDRGAGTELVSELSALVRSHPHRERLVGMAMLALSRAGLRSEAVVLYRRTAELLAEGLGVEPSAELTALCRAIIRPETPVDVRVAA